MPGRLILARHAESDLDAEKRYSGTRDPDLSEHGLREASALAFTLAMNRGMVFDHVLTSNLKAARRTAEIVMRKVGYQHGLDVVQSLDERDYGELTGLTHAEARSRFDEASIRHMAHGDFSKDDPIAVAMEIFLRTRLWPLLSSGKIVLVVSYDDNLRALAAFIEKTDIANEAWRTGMALDFSFGDDMRIASRSTMEDWDWT